MSTESKGQMWLRCILSFMREVPTVLSKFFFSGIQNSADTTLFFTAIAFVVPRGSLPQVAAGQILDGRYRGSVARGTARPPYLSKLVQGTSFRWVQESLPISDKSQERSIRYRGITFGNPQREPGPRPGIFQRNGNHAGSHGI